jgi:hypothetical protein
MMIVKGRGNRRKTFEMPTGEIVRRSPPEQQRDALNMLLNVMGMKS